MKDNIHNVVKEYEEMNQKLLLIIQKIIERKKRNEGCLIPNAKTIKTMAEINGKRFGSVKELLMDLNDDEIM